MLDGPTQVLTEIRNLLSFAPDWVVSILLLALAVVLALAVHGLGMAIFNRTLRTTHPFLRRLLAVTQGPTRFALLLFALALTIPVAPLSADTVNVLSRLLFIGTIVLLGWVAIAAVHVAADIYLMRFRLDTPDNLLARKHVTQVRILTRTGDTVVVVLTIGCALMTFDSVRQYGLSLFASAGVAGLIAGFAARPVLSNLFAGVQLAVTQPIRLEDAVIVENEFGWIEEITSTYVVVRIWDLRRMIVPLTYFIEKPFQNWTREGAELLGTVLLYLDYTAPIDAIRAEAKRIAEASPNWNGKVLGVQVTDAKSATIEVRILVSADNASKSSDLRNELREKVIEFLQREHPHALPRSRQENIDVTPQPETPDRLSATPSTPAQG